MTATDFRDLLADTPAVVIDRHRLMRNLKRVQAIADEHALDLWPHLKTHKCAEIATLQEHCGAAGFTVAKADEALRFMEAGFKKLLIAYPWLAPQKLARLLAAAERYEARLTFTVDSVAGSKLLQASAADHDCIHSTMLKVDVGLHRCGVDPAGPEFLRLAQEIAESNRLELVGLLSHAGHAYGAADVAAVRGIAAAEKHQMSTAVERLSRIGLGNVSISVGATPTVLAHAGFDGVSQIRPGNYVFCDLTQVRLGIVDLQDVALFVVATVVSTGSGRAVIDSGSKSLSSDMAPHSANAGIGYGLAFRMDDPLDISQGMHVERLSEEHGVVRDDRQSLAVGDRIRVYPNHACPVVNLTDRIIVVEDQDVIEVWPVTARCCSR
jgi:D-serine deaminase-like pyridoxal phosphate-dependent protein